MLMPKSMPGAGMSLTAREQGCTWVGRRAEGGAGTSAEDLVLKCQPVEETAATRQLKFFVNFHVSFLKRMDTT